MDMERIEEAINILVDVVREMQAKMDYLHEEVDQLKQASICERLDAVESEFGGMVNGLNDIIDGRRKREYSEKFRSDHPEFGRFEPVTKRMGLDLYDMGATNTFEMDEESAKDYTARMLAELNDKFGDMVDALERMSAHEAAEHGQEMAEKPEGEEKPDGKQMELEIELEPEKPSPIIEQARRMRGQRAG